MDKRGNVVACDEREDETGVSGRGCGDVERGMRRWEWWLRELLKRVAFDIRSEVREGVYVRRTALKI